MAVTESVIDHVYHLTPSDRLGSLDAGLIPNSGRAMPRSWQALEQVLDELVPTRIAALGIRRANAVYAHAESSHIDEIFTRNTGSIEKAAAHLVALQVEVDPTKVIVCDAEHLKFRLDDQKAAQDYWASAMTLAEYRQFYGTDVSPWFHLARREGAPQGLPIAIHSPEVLVPGPIEPNRIVWFASSANRMSQHMYEKW